MRLISERRPDDAVVEREFALGDVPGILWTPAASSAPVPLILVGHPGRMRQMYPRLLARALSAVRQGFAAVTIELPETGERPASAVSRRPHPCHPRNAFTPRTSCALLRRTT